MIRTRSDPRGDYHPGFRRTPTEAQTNARTGTGSSSRARSRSFANARRPPRNIKAGKLFNEFSRPPPRIGVGTSNFRGWPPTDGGERGSRGRAHARERTRTWKLSKGQRATDGYYPLCPTRGRPPPPPGSNVFESSVPPSTPTTPGDVFTYNIRACSHVREMHSVRFESKRRDENDQNALTRGYTVQKKLHFQVVSHFKVPVRWRVL